MSIWHYILVGMMWGASVIGVIAILLGTILAADWLADNIGWGWGCLFLLFMLFVCVSVLGTLACMASSTK